MSYGFKLFLSIALDLVDFTLGRAFGVGMVGDFALGVIAVLLWGPAGLAAFWELLDPSEQIDGFVPTLTLIALSQAGAREKEKDS